MVLKSSELVQSIPLTLLLLLLEKPTISTLLFLHFKSNGCRSLCGFLFFFLFDNKFDVKTGSTLMGSGFSSAGSFSPSKWSEQIYVFFFISEIGRKSFLPQACNQRFAFFVFCFSCLFYQFVMLSFTLPGLANRRKNTPSINRSTYCESELHKPQKQCFVAPVLDIISPDMFSLFVILLGLLWFYPNVSPQFNPIMHFSHYIKIT